MFRCFKKYIWKSILADTFFILMQEVLIINRMHVSKPEMGLIKNYRRSLWKLNYPNLSKLFTGAYQGYFRCSIQFPNRFYKLVHLQIFDVKFLFSEKPIFSQAAPHPAHESTQIRIPDKRFQTATICTFWGSWSGTSV